MDDLDYMIVACVIRKKEHLARYGQFAKDPYMLSLKILVERFIFEVKQIVNPIGQIMAESRNKILDSKLRFAWNEIRTNGTEYIKALEVEKYINKFEVKNKSEKIAGLEIADLIVSPIGRYFCGKEPEQDWSIIEKKFRKSKHRECKGYGLVILPPNKKAVPE